MIRYNRIIPKSLHGDKISTSKNLMLVALRVIALRVVALGIITQLLHVRRERRRERRRDGRGWHRGRERRREGRHHIAAAFVAVVRARGRTTRGVLAGLRIAVYTQVLINEIVTDTRPVLAVPGAHDTINIKLANLTIRVASAYAHAAHGRAVRIA